MSHTTIRPRAMEAALGALLLLGAACKSGKNEEAAAATPPATVTVGPENIALVRQQQVTSGPVISGSLAAEREATLRAQTAGSVLQTLVDQGTRVRKGQLLARLDDTAIQDQYLSARSGVATAQTSYEVAQREAERARKLEAGGAIAQRDLEQANRALSAASSAVADARARLAVAQKQLENTRITAPFDGIVSEKQASAGDVASPGTAIYTVVDPSSMRLEASVPAEQLADVRVGLPVSFTVSGYQDRTFTGRVTRINPTADPVTRQVRLVVSIPNAGNTLVAGLFAEGRVSSETTSAAMLPLSAVDQRGATPHVMRLRKGVVESANVQLGIIDQAAETVEIRSGLAVGDTVLVGAAQGITPGTPVRVSAVTDTRAAATH